MIVYDCQSYSNKPAAAAMGMSPGVVITDWAATDLPDGGIDQPKLEAAAEQAVKLNTPLLVDIERGVRLDGRFYSHSWVVGWSAMLADPFVQLKKSNPTLRIAFNLPSFFWPNRPDDNPSLQSQLRAANLDPALKPLYGSFDVAAPMMYFGTYDGKTPTGLDQMLEFLLSFWGEYQAALTINPNLAAELTVSPRMFPLPGAASGTPTVGVDPTLLLHFLREVKSFQSGAIKAIRVFDDQGYDAVPQPLASQPWFTTLVGFCKNESGL